MKDEGGKSTWQDYVDGTPNMDSKRFDTERSEVENLVLCTGRSEVYLVEIREPGWVLWGPKGCYLYNLGTCRSKDPGVYITVSK